MTHTARRRSSLRFLSNVEAAPARQPRETVLRERIRSFGSTARTKFSPHDHSPFQGPVNSPETKLGEEFLAAHEGVRLSGRCRGDGPPLERDSTALEGQLQGTLDEDVADAGASMLRMYEQARQ